MTKKLRSTQLPYLSKPSASRLRRRRSPAQQHAHPRLVRQFYAIAEVVEHIETEVDQVERDDRRGDGQQVFEDRQNVERDPGEAPQLGPSAFLPGFLLERDHRSWRRPFGL